MEVLMIKTGAEIFVECMKKLEVDTIFGIPGGYLIPILDKIYDSPVKFVLTRHEQGAAHMADGYSRATGKVGVCMATSGPGATNLVTGLATAHMDSIPMVAFTGQVPTTLIGNDAFQEADTTGITRPVTKHNFLVKDVRELAKTIREAFYIASTGRPGPVLVDIPGDVSKASTDFVWTDKVSIESYKPTLAGHSGQIKRAADMINESERPVLYIGGGVVSSASSGEIIELSQKAEIPVTSTLLALGCYPPASELNLDMLGMHGTYYANKAMQNADLIIAVGSRFEDRCTGKLGSFAQKAKIIHIDIDPTTISKTVTVHVPIVGDAKSILRELNKGIKKNSHKDWLKTIREWKNKNPLTYKKDGKLRPQYVVETINEITKGNAIVVTEVGQHQMWAAQFYKPKTPRLFLSSGGLGTMGYGFPAAIGAKLAKPGKLVIDIAGDGSIQMNIQELATAILNKIDVKIVILNNGFLGMVRQWQELFFNKRYSATCLNNKVGCPKKCQKPGQKNCYPYVPDFVKLAQAYGAFGIRVTDKKDVKKALQKAFSVKNTAVVEVVIEPEENVYPMVPAGASLDDMIINLA
jgi:acetolactate synthase-1/2/3 large subunit